MARRVRLVEAPPPPPLSRQEREAEARRKEREEAERQHAAVLLEIGEWGTWADDATARLVDAGWKYFNNRPDYSTRVRVFFGAMSKVRLVPGEYADIDALIAADVAAAAGREQRPILPTFTSSSSSGGFETEPFWFNVED